MKVIKKLLIFLLITQILYSCGQKKQIQEIEKDFSNSNIQINDSEIDSLMLLLPDYKNITTVLEKYQLRFSDSILLPYEKADFYDDTKQTSIMLGMYLADLSYARQFEKVQLCSNYLDAVKILSGKLAISEENINEIAPKIENNLDNNKILFNIVDSLLNKGNSIFDNNETQGINILCITGFLIESTKIVLSENNFDYEDDSYIKYKEILKNIISLLEKINDNGFIKELRVDLQNLYDKDKIKFSDVENIQKKLISFN